MKQYANNVRLCKIRCNIGFYLKGMHYHGCINKKRPTIGNTVTSST